MARFVCPRPRWIRSVVFPLAASAALLLGVASTSAAPNDAAVVVTGPAAKGATGAVMNDILTHQMFFVSATSSGTFVVWISGITIYAAGPFGGTVTISRGAVTKTLTVGTSGATIGYTTQFPS